MFDEPLSWRSHARCAARRSRGFPLRPDQRASRRAAGCDGCPRSARRARPTDLSRGGGDPPGPRPSRRAARNPRSAARFDAAGRGRGRTLTSPARRRAGGDLSCSRPPRRAERGGRFLRRGRAARSRARRGQGARRRARTSRRRALSGPPGRSCRRRPARGGRPRPRPPPGPPVRRNRPAPHGACP